MTEVPVLDLRIEVPGAPAQEVQLAMQGSVVIGRDASCHVVLPSPDVSRRHVELLVEDGMLKLRDTSSNGTLVGEEGERVRRSTIALAPSRAFRVGPYAIFASIRGVFANGLPANGLPAADAAPSQQPMPLTPVDPVATLPPRDGGPGMPRSPAATADGTPAVTSAPSPVARREVPTSTPATSAPATPSTPEDGSMDAVRAAPKEPLLVYARPGTVQVEGPLRRRIHQMLLDHLDLVRIDREKMSDSLMRPRVREALTRILRQLRADLPPETDIANLIEDMSDEALGLGCLEGLLADDKVSEVMVVDARTIFIERGGRLTLTDLRFTDDDAVRSAIERIVTPLGRRIDESSPLVDARLKDGSRVNAVIPPLALRGPCITIRKFPKRHLALIDLQRFDSLDARMTRFLERAVTARKNIVVSGGTGSGKTTLLNALSASIPPAERVVTIEDAAELRLVQPHVVSLEARPPNLEGKGAVTIRDLVKNALRMRPDRIVVGECRGGEALDMLQAMNTGHDGSMTTTHANSPAEAIQRLETLVLMSGVDLPVRAIREQIASSVHVIVQNARLSDGSRRVLAIAEITGIDDEGRVSHRNIFEFAREGTSPEGTVLGEYRATGYLPTFVEDFITLGLVEKGNYL